MDVFIPFHPKDQAALPHCIAAVRRFVQPCVGKIFVIAAEPPVDIQDAEFLDEASVIPGFSPRSMAPIVVNRQDRTGWYFQQMIKFAVASICRTEEYLVIDADCVLLAPISFRQGNQLIFYTGDQPIHEPYKKSFWQILGFVPLARQSFICDYMVMSRNIVRDLIDIISKNYPDRPWHETIHRFIDRIDPSSFSEFETYGWFVETLVRSEYISLPARGTVGRGTDAANHFLIAPQAVAHGFTSISYHSYLA